MIVDLHNAHYSISPNNLRYENTKLRICEIFKEMELRFSILQDIGNWSGLTAPR